MPTDAAAPPDGPARPPLVVAADALAAELGFGYSCSTGTGRLLATLAASVTGTVGESGTGCGVGTSWLRGSLRPGGRIVTVERDPARAAAAARLFRDDDAVTVLAGEWTEIRAAGGLVDRFPVHRRGGPGLPTESVVLATRA
jgi:predicted O-methyltransferase YrrM